MGEVMGLKERDTYELNVADRMILLNTLPSEGDITTLRIVRDLKLDLSFSEAEHAELQFENLPNGGVRWQKDIRKEVVIGRKGVQIIAEALQKLNKEKKLNEQHVSVWDKFVGE